MGNLRLENVRLAYANLTKPQKFDANAKPEFSVQALIPKSDEAKVGEIRALMSKLAEEKWPGKGNEVLKTMIMQDKICLRDGDKAMDKRTGQVKAGHAGHYYIRAKLLAEEGEPILLGVDGRVLDHGEIAQGVQDIPYSGCYGHVNMNLWVQDNTYGQRINASLEVVMFSEQGDRFGRAQPSAAGMQDLAKPRETVTTGTGAEPAAPGGSPDEQPGSGSAGGELPW
jgi:hypothetical protein